MTNVLSFFGQRGEQNEFIQIVWGEGKADKQLVCLLLLYSVVSDSEV